MGSIRVPANGFDGQQISAYYERISLPAHLRISPNSATDAFRHDPQKALDFLTAIQKYQITHVPFENLALHYTPRPSVSTNPSDVYDKIVNRHRGGYCMENTLLLYHVLLGLGFDVYATGGRVFKAIQPIADKEDWVGVHWNHMVLLLTLADRQTYLLDTGFSNMSPVAPVPLQDGIIMRNSGLTDIRLVKPRNPAHRSPELDLWEYQIRFSEAQDWVPAYAFSQLHFTPGDFACMSFYTSTQSDSWFTIDVVAAIMIMDKNERVEGDVTLFRDECKKRVDGKNEWTIVCQSEAERTDLLKKEFFIDFTEEEKMGIRGRPSEIK